MSATVDHAVEDGPRTSDTAREPRREPVRQHRTQYRRTQCPRSRCHRTQWLRAGAAVSAALALSGCGTGTAGGGEANLTLPDFHDPAVSYLGMSGWALLALGMLVCLAGMAFGVITYLRLKRLPVHDSMREISELIYQTCVTYLTQQGRFLIVLWVFIAAVITVYYAALVGFPLSRVAVILLMSLLGMAGSYGVAWYGIRVNTFANSRSSFAALRGKPYPTHRIPMQSGMSVGMVLISVELFMMLFIMLFLPGNLAGSCFIGFAIGESLGAAALRIAGGIFTKIADIGSDLMKIAFHIKEDDARNPGVIADCTGDNAGDSVGPSADGFETYGVTGVALITFVLLAVPGELANSDEVKLHLLVWIFAIRIVMMVASFISYAINSAITRARWADAEQMDFEAPLTSLVWITSLVSIALTFVASYGLLGSMGEPATGLWWKLSVIVSCGTLAGALIPELVKAFTSTKSRHVKEVVVSTQQGGPSLNILSGVVSGNFSGYWLGITIVGLMGIAAAISTLISDQLMVAPAVFAMGLVAFGFLGMGPVTIAVDSYGPVTDNAQSVYELSMIEDIDGIDAELERDYGFTPQWDRAKRLLEENDGAGNTFKATAKPVLIGTAVVGATTMIFSILISLSSAYPDGIQDAGFLHNMSLLNPLFLLGLISGGAIIYWFSGASMQAVTTGAYRAVSFIRENIHLEGSTRASTEDSKKVVQICTQYAQRGMINIFLGVFFATLGFAFLNEYLFIGYLISIAVFGLYQAIYMANAGGAWDNAKKIVEVDLDAKGTPLHDASVVGDTVGDPFKDTSSVSLNPIIKFSTLFGLLAVELAVALRHDGAALTAILAAVFLLVSAVFVYRSFYRMRIGLGLGDVRAALGPEPHESGIAG
ncbi:K(+)-stimulated pyrophosphate-energized sodium pump [Propionibacterium cyclohexanicum]|mgnify:CR=1 FL=1|uniref:K(+)-insensitive pyrophosphate-energized proton pump n=1 Tax=Propionibacterium cyclohexanicum TaxID=64702 RepID=A0A1H9PLH8_9ACTN|nr:sodium-translocating pyrophosphatase [Propionibacterium cyclohexanicum]SER49028.1 K(+)-stimulated pyrophosphate-energized sodium pump [Propionibacterium cyclohexanicum]